MKLTNKYHDTRQLITIEILNEVVSQFQLVCRISFEVNLFKSAFSQAFHALLPVGEIAFVKGNTKDKLIQIADVK